MLKPSEKNIPQFIKLNLYTEEGADANANPIFVRSTEIATLHRESDASFTIVMVKGVDDPLRVMQTPDEMLALMKDDNASVLGNTTSTLILKVDPEEGVLTPNGVAA